VSAAEISTKQGGIGESETRKTSCQLSAGSGQSLSGCDVGASAIPHIPVEEPTGNDDETPSHGGSANEGGKRLTDEQVRTLTNFVTGEPESEEPETPQQKRLATQRARVEEHRGLLIQIGEHLDDDDRRFDIKEGGRTHKVAAREFMMEK